MDSVTIPIIKVVLDIDSVTPIFFILVFPNTLDSCYFDATVAFPKTA